MVNHAILDQRVDRGGYRLGRNSKAGASKGSSARDQEGVDADQFTMRIHQRTTGVAGVDRCVGLNKPTRFASIIRVRIRPVDCAHNATSDGEAEIAERISDGQYRLS